MSLFNGSRTLLTTGAQQIESGRTVGRAIVAAVKRVCQASAWLNSLTAGSVEVLGFHAEARTAG